MVLISSPRYGKTPAILVGHADFFTFDGELEKWSEDETNVWYLDVDVENFSSMRWLIFARLAVEGDGNLLLVRQRADRVMNFFTLTLSFYSSTKPQPF